MEFVGDLKKFLNEFKIDFLNEQGQFGRQMIEHLQLDENVQTGLQTIHSHTSQLIETLYQISLFGENLFQEYLNKYFHPFLNSSFLFSLALSFLFQSHLFDPSSKFTSSRHLAINYLSHQYIHLSNDVFCQSNIDHVQSFYSVFSFIQCDNSLSEQ